jgi:hypothetical protein
MYPYICAFWKIPFENFKNHRYSVSCGDSPLKENVLFYQVTSMSYLKKTFHGAEAKGIKCNELLEKFLPIKFWQKNPANEKCPRTYDRKNKLQFCQLYQAGALFWGLSRQDTLHHGTLPVQSR